ncbi:FtsX-like permease family protein [Streptomyces kanamyceticus]|uniref:FtsX-like permease family protein n=1 Tax=Streptomyces kanamyceticus TaxID=1967 RepID=A0A5J6GKH2_STRKN|nr:FtsX-like permease family protein [Streptomyces kanamyceticus]QEU94318.1 FtsX-like permease family protein [Streptomyces kanamyceticus]
MTGFIFLRVRAHRLLLAAALLAVLLTTAVLATLTAFSGAIGDAALRQSLRTRSAPQAALVVRTQVPPGKDDAAREEVEEGARRTFDGLPVRLRSLARSGTYALPEKERAGRGGQPDLTRFAALDRSRIKLVKGAWPTGTTGTTGSGGTVEVALPETAAAKLKLGPGAAPLTLTDRLTGPKVTVRVTGVYRPTDATDPYWQLDELGGRGVRKGVFMTYGPLLVAPSVLTGSRVSTEGTQWLATADFAAMTTRRVDALRDAATEGPAALTKNRALGGNPSADTALPKVLDRAERALLVSRSTLLIVALQLIMLAGYALLLVARLLSTERGGETELLLARGGSRGRITWLAAVEALLLALPAAVIAPLLAAPLTRLLAGQGALSRTGLRLEVSAGTGVWLAGLVTALGCALAVVAPALSAASGGRRSVRVPALPAPLRAGADVGLLVIAGVAYWQLDSRTSGSGALSDDRGGQLGIDPLLVAAPALALLAGTVVTLRLLPPAARLAERRAARGRGLPGALAGWQLSRRPLRGAGPVLLLVLSVAMGMLAVGQGASWDRSQEDQADFRAGAQIRVLGSRVADGEQAGVFGALPGVRAAAPAVRDTMSLSDDRQATVLALDTAKAVPGLLTRDDLGNGATITAALAPDREPTKAAAEPRAVVTDAFLDASGSRVGDRIEVPAGSRKVPVRISDAVPELPTAGAPEGASGPGGGGILLDLPTLDARLAKDGAKPLAPSEWWLTTGDGEAAQAAAALRSRPDIDPEQVLVRDEIAAQLRDDPLGAGPQAALLAVAAAAAALAAVGFAVSAAGSLRERSAEFAVLRGLGAPRRQLARLIAAEQGFLLGLALLVGLGLGAVLTRAVIPLIVLTGEAAQPVPPVLVELPLGRVALLLAATAAVPLLIIAALSLRRGDPKVSLRHEGGH